MFAPHTLSPVLRALINQIAAWDSTEECWEIFVPLPHTIRTKINGTIDDTLVWHEFAQAHNIDYSFFGFDKDKGTSVIGIAETVTA